MPESGSIGVAVVVNVLATVPCPGVTKSDDHYLIPFNILYFLSLLNRRALLLHNTRQDGWQDEDEYTDLIILWER